jgi:hypothetical protein
MGCLFFLLRRVEKRFDLLIKLAVTLALFFQPILSLGAGQRTRDIKEGDQAIECHKSTRPSRTGVEIGFGPSPGSA